MTGLSQSSIRRRESALADYRRVLDQMLAEPDEEAALSQAYNLGRTLLAAGMGLLDLLDLHHQVLAERLGAISPPVKDYGGSAGVVLTPRDISRAAGRLLAEAMSSHEMLLRGYTEANDALLRMNERLERQIGQIAHALHDESGQLLAAVFVELDQSLKTMPEAEQLRLEPVRELLERMENQLRRMAHELRPTILDDLGLRAALEFLSDGVAARNNLAITVEGQLNCRLPPPVELGLYRCVQECLNNVVRHARARKVRIRLLSGPQALEIRVADDGCGFDPAPAIPARGIGLVGLRERMRVLGGKLEIRSHPGSGAEIRLQLPGVVCGGNYVPAPAVS